MTERDPDALARVAELVCEQVAERTGGEVHVDRHWRPAVQGAVGHVVGLRSGAGEAWVAKLFGEEQAVRAATELHALRLAEPVLGSLAPRVIADVQLAPHGVHCIVMSRLPGDRWSDRRPSLDLGQRTGVIGDVGALLRRLHTVSGPAFGSLLEDGRRWASGLEQLRHLCAETVDAYLAAGGRGPLAEGVRRLVDRHAAHWDSDVRPVLCHHDVNGGNVLLGPGATPRVSGVVDFERTSWDDPMRDLSLTVLHLRHEEPETIPALLDAYGPLADGDSQRLHVHVALRAMAEHTWVVTDRPQGWRQSADRLEDLVEEHLAART